MKNLMIKNLIFTWIYLECAFLGNLEENNSTTMYLNIDRVSYILLKEDFAYLQMFEINLTSGLTKNFNNVYLTNKNDIDLIKQELISK